MTVGEQILGDAANIAEILTAAAAVLFSVRAAYQAYGRKVRLEEYLKEIFEREKPKGNQGAMTDIRLGADLGMTIQQIHEAAFVSGKVKRRVIINPETHRASGVMFQYKEN